MPITTSQGQPSDNRASDFSGVSIPDRVGYRFMDLDPGSNLYVQRDDVLIVQAMTSNGPDTINIGLRQLIPGRDVGRTQPDAATVDNSLGDSPFGAVIPIASTLALPINFTTAQTIIQLSEGYLLSVAVSCATNSMRGTTFVKVFIARAGTNVAAATYALCADYVTNNSPTGWPFGRIISPTEGPGRLRTNVLGNPGAGNDFNYTVAPSVRQRIISFEGVFTASGVAGNRQIVLRIRDTTLLNEVGRYVGFVAITAAQVVNITAAAGVVNSTLTGVDQAIALPQDTYLANNGTTTALQSVVVNKDAGDTWTALRMYVEEWLDF